MPRPHLLLASHIHEGRAVAICTPQLSYASARTSGLAVRLEGQSDGLFDSFRQAGDLVWRVLRSSPSALARDAGWPVCFSYRLGSPDVQSLVDQWGSADLACFVTALLDRVAQACGLEDAGFSPLAATGHLFGVPGSESSGAAGGATRVHRVGGIEAKLRAALARLLPLGEARILIPRENLKDLSSEHQEWVRRGVVVPVAQLEDVLDALKTLPVLPDSMRDMLCDLHAPFRGNPYRGIEAFGIEHRGLYFGRERQVAAVFSHLPESPAPESPDVALPAVLVTGFSGSGKSSLLLAGVLGKALYAPVKGHRFLPHPAQLADSSHVAWRVASAGGMDEAALCESLRSYWRALAGVETFSTCSLQALADALIPQIRPEESRAGRWVFALDQLEGLVTQVGQDDQANVRLQALLERFALFLDRLRQEAGVWLLATVRSGYLEALGPLWRRVFHTSGHVDLNRRDDAGSENLTEAERWERCDAQRQQFLREVIERPARLAGLGLDADLLDDLIRDARDPQSLPLLQFALQALHERASGRCAHHACPVAMSRADYEAIGGIRGAIDQRANQLLRDAGDRRDVLLGVLARLARERIDANGQRDHVRAVVSWSSYTPDEQRLLEPWISAEHRLLTRQGDHIEVAHEALLRAFTALREWLIAHGQMLRWRQDHLVPQLRRWLECGCDAAQLLLARDDLEMGGRALEQGRLLAHEEATFVGASLDAAQRREEEENERKEALVAATARLAHEQKIALRRTRLWLLATGILLGIVLLAGISVRKAEVEKQARLVDAANRALGRASDALARNDIRAYSAFVVESLLSAESSGASAAAAMILQGAGLPRAVRAHQIALYHGGALSEVRHSPDGRWLVTIGDDESVRFWDARSGEPIDSAEGPGAALISPDGRWVVRTTGAEVAVLEVGPDMRIVGIPLSGNADLVRFSPDGGCLVTVSGNEIRAWDVRTGQPTGTPLTGEHFTRVTAIRVGPDCASVAVVDGVMGAGVWDVRSGDYIDGLPCRARERCSMDFSPDGRWVFGAGRQAAGVWEMQTGSFLNAFRDVYSVNFLRFSPDSRKIVIATTSHRGENSFQIWDLESGMQIGETKRSGAIRMAEFTPDARLVVTTGGLGADVWDAETGAHLGTRIYRAQEVIDIDISPDGRLMLTATDQEAQMWNIRTGKMIGEPMRHEGGLLSAEFSPDGRSVVTANSDGAVRVWSVRTHEALGLPLRHRSKVDSVQFSPDGRRVMTASQGGGVRVWDAHTGAMVFELGGADDAFNSASFSPDGQWIVTANSDSSVQIWDAASGEPVGEKVRGDEEAWSAEFSPDGRWVMALGEGAAQVWEAKTRARIAMPTESEEVLSARFSPGGQSIVTASDDDLVRLWALPSGERVDAFEVESVSNAVFSPDGRWIATTSGERRYEPDAIRLWDAASRTHIAASPAGEWKDSISFSPDSRLMLVMDRNAARIWNLEADELSEKPLSHEHSIDVAQFSPDGRWIMTAGADLSDDSIRLWEARTGAALGGPRSIASGIESARFSPDGRWIATVNWDGTASLWSAYTDLGVDRSRLALAVHALSGVETDATGQLRELTETERSKVRAELLLMADGAGLFDQAVRWHFADPATRAIAPFSRQTVPQFIDNAIDFVFSLDLDDRDQRQLALSVLESAYEADPAHPLILAALAGFERHPDTRHLWKEIAFQRIAGDAGVAARAAELFWRMGDMAATRRAANIALAADPDHAAAQALMEKARMSSD